MPMDQDYQHRSDRNVFPSDGVSPEGLDGSVPGDFTGRCKAPKLAHERLLNLAKTSDDARSQQENYAARTPIELTIIQRGNQNQTFSLNKKSRERSIQREMSATPI